MRTISRNAEVLLTVFPWPLIPLKTLLEARKDDFCNQNMEASWNRCSALLQAIFGPLENEVTQGIYSKPGGHFLFIQKTEELKARYYQQPRKGMQVFWVLSINCRKVLRGFFQKSMRTGRKYLYSNHSCGIKLKYVTILTRLLLQPWTFTVMKGLSWLHGTESQ